MNMDVTCDAYSIQHPYSNIKKVSFHLFPKDRETKQKWIDAIRTYRKGYLPSKTSVLCSEHFIHSDFTPRGMRLVLRPSSVPSVFDEVCMRRHKAMNESKLEIDKNRKLYNELTRNNFSYKSYKANKTPPQLNLKLKPELLALLQKRNKPILLRRKPKETGNKKKIPECIWVMPSGSVSTSPNTELIQPRSRPSIQLVIPKGPLSSTDVNKNLNKVKNIFGANVTQNTLSPDEFVKEEQDIHNEDQILEIKELIKQEHEYCIKSEDCRPETEIEYDLPEIKQEFQFVNMKEENEIVNGKEHVLRVRQQSELMERSPYQEANQEPELIVPELTAEINMELVDESKEERREYFEFVDVDMTDSIDFQEDSLRNTQIDELILS